ncbi:MAG: primosomal protein N' [Armatimonadota bacterium]|nr:primosomal protein N' [Armatimonadota bacterium]MDR7494185.1 primosomal protein N' [Armatimonadota bacterium]MDR7558750.1 primosomal protein N' [Armatimonadota bacterium]
MLVDVAVNAPLRAGDRAFTFAVPEALQDRVTVGLPVRVPFGRGHTTGFVVAPGTRTDRPLRPIAGVDERLPPLPADLVALALWMADYYVCSVGEAIWAMLPPPAAAARARAAAEPLGTPPAADGMPAAPETGREPPGHGDGTAPVGAHLRRDPAARIALIADGARFRGYEEALRWLGDGDRNAIFLVPEVSQAEALTRWIARRSALATVVMHGELPDAERWALWRRISSGGVRIVVGTRLAVFAPLPRLGLIVIDHEEDASYKEERAPRYHARRVAEERAARSRAALLWGTPAPSAEVMREVLEHRALAVVVPQGRPPAVVLSSARSERGRPASLIGPRLEEGLRRVLPWGRAILFVPRRGFADFLLCRECGWVPRCPRCGVALTYYAGQRRLRCHLCGREEGAPQLCAHCGGTQLRPRGVGTERVERAARRLFPSLPVYRLDAAAAPAEPQRQRIWRRFGRAGGLLIGTQLLLRGVGQIDAAVVGAIGADSLLHLPDFRSAERTFQILRRLALLAREEMIVQTFDPSHPVLQALAAQDAAGFYRQELDLRRQFHYPPYRTLINLVISSPTPEEAREVSGQFAAAIGGGDVLGPSPAPLARVRGRYRFQVLVKERDELAARRSLTDLVRSRPVPRGTKVVVDVDPVELL